MTKQRNKIGCSGNKGQTLRKLAMERVTENQAGKAAEGQTIKCFI